MQSGVVERPRASPRVAKAKARRCLPRRVSTRSERHANESVLVEKDAECVPGRHGVDTTLVEKGRWSDGESRGTQQSAEALVYSQLAESERDVGESPRADDEARGRRGATRRGEREDRRAQSTRT